MPGVPGIQSYSTAAASNTALFPEGMPPSGVNDGMRQVQADIRKWYVDAEWANYGDTPSRASATSFKITGDVTVNYPVHTRLKCYDATTIYSTITASTYGAPDTTITVVNDSGSLTTSLTSVARAIISPANLSIPSTIGRKGSDIASATTTDIGAATADFVDVTGTTTITGLGTITAGVFREVRFTGALLLTHNGTSLILPTAANITTAANDTAIFRSLGAGNWICTQYKRANGTSVGSFDITGQTALTAPDGADELAIYDASATANKKITLVNMINGQVEDTAPDLTADFVQTYDVSATNTKKVLLNRLGGWVKISSTTASSSATVDFTGLSSTYGAYMVMMHNVSPATDDVSLIFRTSTDNGSTYDAGAGTYSYEFFGYNLGSLRINSSSSATGITISSTTSNIMLSNVSNEHYAGHIIIHNPSAAKPCIIEGQAHWYTSAATQWISGVFGGVRLAAADVDAIRFLMSSGNTASGVFTLYGALA